MYYTQNSYVCFEYNSILGKRWTTTTRLLQKSWCANARRTCTLPRPTSLRQKEVRKFGSLEAWKLGFSRLTPPLHSAFSVAPQGRSCISCVAFSGRLKAWKLAVEGSRFALPGFRGGVSPCTIYYKDRARGGGRGRGQRRGCRPISESANSANQQALRRSAYVFAVPISPDTIRALHHLLYIIRYKVRDEGGARRVRWSPKVFQARPPSRKTCPFSLNRGSLPATGRL